MEEIARTMTCPKCGSKNLRGNTPRWNGKDYTYLEKCLNCGYKWEAIYSKGKKE